MSCKNCGANATGTTCEYCGTVAARKPERKRLLSNMGDFHDLKDTLLIGNMNTVKGCVNCEIRGNMNDITKACPDTIVVGNMNDIRRVR